MSGTLRRVAPPSFKEAEDRDDKDGGASGPRANRAPMGRAARRAALPSCKEAEDKDDKDGGASGPRLPAARASRAPAVRTIQRVAPPSCEEVEDKDGASGPLLPAARANRAPMGRVARRAKQHSCKEVKDKDNGTILIRTFDDWTKMQHGSQPVIVMFTSDMCGACKRMKTLYPSMKQHLPSNVTFAIVDHEQSDKAIFRDALGELAFMPAFQMHRAGQRLAYFAASDEETLRKRVEELAPVAEPRPIGCFSFLIRARA